MKKLLTLLALLPLVAAVAQADPDVPVACNTAQNVQITLIPNGVLDANPTWTISGNGSITTDGGGHNFTFISSGSGTSTVQFTATSQGNPLSVRIIVTVTAAPLPATTLGAKANPIPK